VRTIGWAGRGLRSPLHDALLADSVPVWARGRAFGFDEAADTAGAIAGPLAALAVIGLLSSIVNAIDAYKIGFWFASVPGVLAAVSILALVKETAHPTLGDTSFVGSLKGLPLPFRRYLVSVLIFGCGDFSHTLLILYAVQMLTASNPQNAGTVAITLYTLHNILYAGGAYPAGALADRYGKSWLLVGAYLLAVLMNILLIAAAPSVLTLAAVFLVAGMGYALQQSLERAIAADMAPVEVRSTGFGVLATVNGIGDFVSSVVVGALWTAFSPTVAFTYSLILTGLGALIMAATLRSNAATASSL